MVVEVPIDAGEGVRTARDLSVWEQLSFAAFLQRYWADNQVSMFLNTYVSELQSARCTLLLRQMLMLHVPFEV